MQDWYCSRTLEKLKTLLPFGLCYRTKMTRERLSPGKKKTPPFPFGVAIFLLRSAAQAGTISTFFFAVCLLELDFYNKCTYRVWKLGPALMPCLNVQPVVYCSFLRLPIIFQVNCLTILYDQLVFTVNCCRNISITTHWCHCNGVSRQTYWTPGY